jgi:hypothetical protein
MLALVPGGSTAYLAFNHGGFFAGATALAAAELGVVLAIYLLLARRPAAGLGVFSVAAAVAMAAFAAWTLASSGWSESPVRATPEYVRALLYGLALVTFAVLPYSVRRLRLMLYGLAFAIVAICVTALLARTLPELLPAAADIKPHRLGHPLGYWNALGLLAAIGIVLCGHLASSVREPRVARVAGAAAIPLLTATLYYTFSRAGTWTALGAVALYVVVGRPRGLLCAALATVPAAAFALVAANPPGPLTGSDPLGPAAVAAGHRVALALLASAVVAAVVRAACLPLDDRLARLRLAGRLRRPVLAGAAAVGLAGVLAASVTLHVPSVVEAKYREFTSDRDHVAGYAGASRLGSAGSNGRIEHWEAALAAYRRDPLHGTGAGTYAQVWLLERHGEKPVRDAHSLYLEVLAELGLPGLLALVTALLLILGAFAARARGPDRALFAALLAAGLAWAAHAGVDWDWEMPAVTLWLFAFGGAALAARGRRRSTPYPVGLVARAAAVAACLALVALPARVAISESRLADARAAVARGDCSAADSAARAAARTMSDRPGPHHVIGFCHLRERRWGAARRALRRAVSSDRRNWELRYAHGVARAATGRDPRRELRLAVALNPHSDRARGGLEMLGASHARAWRRAGRRAPIAPPLAGDP